MDRRVKHGDDKAVGVVNCPVRHNNDRLYNSVIPLSLINVLGSMLDADLYILVITRLDRVIQSFVFSMTMDCRIRACPRLDWGIWTGPTMTESAFELHILTHKPINPFTHPPIHPSTHSPTNCSLLTVNCELLTPDF